MSSTYRPGYKWGEYPTYSGSGAVFDYLAGRGDLHDPLAGEEYQLPQVPHGLMALEAASGHASHPPVADFSLNRFEDIVSRLARPCTKWRYGKDYARKLPTFPGGVEQFIDEVTTARLPMRLDWHRLMQSPGKRVLSQLKARLGIDEPPQPTRLIAQREQLVAAACAMHNRIFQHGAEGRTVQLNQAGSGWNPVESTIYFDNRRIVLVSRDPRDQFIELKQHKKVTCVEGFVDWYKQMQKHLGKIENSCLLNVRFEDFVRHNDGVVKDVCKHLYLSNNVKSSYKPELSAKNIGKYRQFVSQAESQILEEHLSEYFHSE